MISDDLDGLARFNVILFVTIHLHFFVFPLKKKIVYTICGRGQSENVYFLKFKYKFKNAS